VLLEEHIAFNILQSACDITAFALVFSFTAEIFSTDVRTTGGSLLYIIYICGQVGGSLTNGRILHVIVLSVVGLVSLVLPDQGQQALDSRADLHRSLDEQEELELLLK